MKDERKIGGRHHPKPPKGFIQQQEEAVHGLEALVLIVQLLIIIFLGIVLIKSILG